MAVCPSCGFLGVDPRRMRCEQCGAWTTSETGALGIANAKNLKAISQVTAELTPRASVGQPWDECFGGGIVWTSSTLVGGAPGSGKTTGLIQILFRLIGLTGKRGYYLSAEQAAGDLRITVDRLGFQPPDTDLFYVLTEFGAGAEIDEKELKEHPPAGMIVDSVSALCGKDVHAAIAIAKRYKKLSVLHKAPAFLICHMTKEHDFAGLMALQHEVDTLVTIFPDEDGSRTMKAWKNRYGSTHAEYKLMMTGRGLEAMPPPEEERPRARRKKDTPEIPPPPSDEAPRVTIPRRRPKEDAILHEGQKLVRKKKKGEK